MSIQALNWAFQQQLPHAEKSVLVALAHRADKDGYCYPGIETIAEMTGASRRTVIRALQSLDDKKLFTRERRFRSNGSRTSTSYTLNLSATVTPTPSATMTPSDNATKCHHDTPLSATVTPPPYKSVLISQIDPTDREEKNETTMIEKTEPQPTAQTLIAEWIDNSTHKPPGRVIGHLSKEIKNLLDEGYDYPLVRTAVMEWNRKGLHPATLPSILDQVLKTGTPQTGTRRRMEEALNLGKQLQEEYDNRSAS